MADQMEKQREQGIRQADKNWVHQMSCFAWGHDLVNIHETIAVDMLHQLQKGVFRDLVTLVGRLVNDLVPGDKTLRGKKKQNRSYKQSAGLVQLDARFSIVPPFPGLKHFKRFSHVQQWTGSEERDLLRIFIPVITPLLLPKAADALSYARALVDFITLAQYRTHDDMTLNYMGQALYRIDHTKEAFGKYRPKDSDGNPQWNYPKFHSLSHYITWIRRFGPPNGSDSEHMEVGHKTKLKLFYDLTNKNDGYLKQIASHNTRETSRLAMDQSLLHFFGTTSEEGVNIEVHATAMSKTPMLLTKMNCFSLTIAQIQQLRALRLDVKTTTLASEAARATNLKGFIEALAVFVKRSRAEICGELIKESQRDQCEADSSWVCNYPIQFFGSVRCWRRTGKDETDTEAMESELLRCTPSWRGLGPRQDYCWVQEYPPTEPSYHQALNHAQDTNVQSSYLNGQRVGHLRALIKVVDIDFPDLGIHDRRPEYCAALVDIHPLKNKGVPHPIHGIVEVTRGEVPTVDKPRALKGRRFYPLSTLIRSAHIIPASHNILEKSTDLFYINNYIDWDQYQVLYEDGWEEKGRQRARQVKAQHDAARAKVALRM
jgi:hypothetical protein